MDDLSEANTSRADFCHFLRLVKEVQAYQVTIKRRKRYGKRKTRLLPGLCEHQ
jgi:hypothetical protein